MLEISNECVITCVANAQTAATTLVTSSVLNMQGFSAVAFFASLGTVTSGSVLQLTAYENTANSTSSPTPVAVTGGATPSYTAGSSSSNTLLLLDVIRPTSPYVFVELSRTTDNAVVNGIYAIQYRTTSAPVTQPAATVAQQLSTPEV